MTRKMKDIIGKRLNIYREKPVVSHGLIGNLGTGVVNVPGRTGVIYVTAMDGAVSEVVNRRVPSVLRTPVLYGRDPGDMPNTLQVLSPWDVYAGMSENNPANGTPYHHEQHQWPQGDTVYVGSEQILPSLYYPGTELKVKVYPGNYYTTTGWLQEKHILTVDLSAVSPALAANECRMVLIVIDKDGAAAARVGSIVTGWATLAASDIPLPEVGDNAICAVKMFYGQTVFRMDGNNNDFIDLRWTGVANGATLIGDGAVTNAKMADMVQATFKGRATGAGTGAPVDLTAHQAALILGGTGSYCAVATRTNDYTLTVNDYLVVLSGTTARTFTLPAATGSGQTYRIANESTATLTVDGAGAETIKGALTQTLYQGEDLIITDYVIGAWA
jgi:hypothetical protein